MTEYAIETVTRYQVYQSTTQGLAVTGLSPGTTYYFTLRISGANGVYVDYGQRSVTTVKAFWQERWFPYVVFFVVLIGVAAIAISILYIRSNKKAHVIE